MSEPQGNLLTAGRRLHLHHGPIDLIVESFGVAAEVLVSYQQARERFRTVLAELVCELPLLRTQVTQLPKAPQGAMAQCMVAAVRNHDGFVTPMAAVAGAVAEEILEALTAGRSLRRAYVNNGGDIAFMLEAGACFQVGVVNNAALPGLNAQVELHHDDPVRGLATSGWRGRSFSCGIADAVTVLARTAAEADVAATLIAGAVNTDHPGIIRKPACELTDDSDLGARLVTVSVPKLPCEAVSAALARGAEYAQQLRESGRIEAAYLALQGATRIFPNPQTQQTHDRPDSDSQNHHHA